MKTERTTETQESRRDRQRHADHTRPRRTTAHGPVGFGSVLHDVRRERDGGGTGMGAGAEQFHQAQLDLVDPATQAVLASVVPRTGQQEQVDASCAATADTTVDDGGRAATANHVHEMRAMPIVRLTPAAALDRVVDEATKLDIERASRELHVELDPVHLGPLMIRFKREPGGRLNVDFHAERADAADALDSGMSTLRSALADAGFRDVVLRVERNFSHR